MQRLHQARTLLTAQRAVRFPPHSDTLLPPPWLAYASLLAFLGYAQTSRFLTEDPEEMGRKAKAGERVFSSSVVSQALRELQTVQNKWAAYKRFGFPDFAPRIDAVGGVEGAVYALGATKDAGVAKEAAALLDHLTGSSMFARGRIAGDEVALTNVVERLKMSLNEEFCPACGSSAASATIEHLLFTLIHVLLDYPFGKVVQRDVMLAEILKAVSTRVLVVATEQERNVEIPLDEFATQPHDPDWAYRVSSCLVKLSSLATFDVKTANRDGAFETVCKPLLQNLTRLNTLGIFVDEEEIEFGAIAAEAWGRGVRLDIDFSHVVEDSQNSSLFFSTPLRRRFVHFTLDQINWVWSVVLGAGTGYVWGVTRTLIALRDVTQVPSSMVPQQQHQLGVGPAQQPPQQQPHMPLSNPMSWRWQMSRKFGIRAAFGAGLCTFWSEYLSDKLDFNVKGELSQFGLFLTKTGVELGTLWVLFRNFPFFFLPSVFVHTVAADAVGSGDSDDDDDGILPRLEIQFGRDDEKRGRGGGKGGGGPGGSKGQWT